MSKQKFYLSKQGYKYENGIIRISRKKLQQIVKHNKLKNILANLAYSHLFWDEIVEIEEEKYDGFVYDVVLKMWYI